MPKKDLPLQIKNAPSSSLNRHLMQRIRFLFVVQIFLLFLLVAEGMQQPADQREIFLGIIDVFPDRSSNLGAKEHISLLVNGIFESNKKLLQGVEEVVVYTQNIQFMRDGQAMCGDHILGAFSGKKILIKDAGKEINERTLYHEIGHNVWRHLSDQQKEEWKRIFEKNKDTVSRYANVNENENFAENVACYFTDFEGCKERMRSDRIQFIEKAVQ